MVSQYTTNGKMEAFKMNCTKHMMQDCGHLSASYKIRKRKNHRIDFARFITYFAAKLKSEAVCSTLSFASLFIIIGVVGGLEQALISPWVGVPLIGFLGVVIFAATKKVNKKDR